MVASKKLLTFWQITFYVLLFITLATSECGVCQENNVACINSTSFYMCFGATTPNFDKLYHCKEGFDCTNINAICRQRSTLPPSCGDTSLCGNCSAHKNHLFTCLSQSTFQMCYGAIRPTGEIGKCPRGYVCQAKSDNICVNANEATGVTCDLVDPDGENTTKMPFTSSSTHIPEEPTTPDEVCAQMRQVGLFPPIPTDPYCKRYIYCYYSNGLIKGMVNSCSTGTYFATDREMCTFTKPNYCL